MDEMTWLRTRVVARGFIGFLGFLYLGLVSLAAPAFAQSRDPFFSDVSANFDFVYHQQDTTSNLGAHFDFARTIKRDVPFLSVMGEIGVNHFDDANVSSYLAGVRLRFPNASPRVLPFAQIIGGLYHCGPCDVNDFATQLGGGVDIKMPKNNWRIRAQLDWRHIFDEFEDANAVRVSAGVVLPLNK